MKKMRRRSKTPVSAVLRMRTAPARRMETEERLPAVVLDQQARDEPRPHLEPASCQEGPGPVRRAADLTAELVAHVVQRALEGQLGHVENRFEIGVVGQIPPRRPSPRRPIPLWLCSAGICPVCASGCPKGRSARPRSRRPAEQASPGRHRLPEFRRTGFVEPAPVLRHRADREVPPSAIDADGEFRPARHVDLGDRGRGGLHPASGGRSVPADIAVTGFGPLVRARVRRDPIARGMLRK